MSTFFIVGGFVLVLMVVMFRAISKPGNRRISSGPGPGAAGAIYDLLNEDKRKAIEIIVEGRAEHRDPETADDIPPDEDEQDGAAPRPPRARQD